MLPNIGEVTIIATGVAWLVTPLSEIIEEPLDPTETYAASLTVRNQLGQVIADGVTNFGVWFGMSSTMAGIVILVLMMLAIGGYTYVKFQSPLVPDAILIALPILGAYLGTWIHPEILTEIAEKICDGIEEVEESVESL